MYYSGLRAHLTCLLQEQALHILFQPIFDLRAQRIAGYEAFMRGPVGSPLHTPEQLLRVARESGLGLPLERLACGAALQAFAQQHLPGRLFLNLSPGALAAPDRASFLLNQAAAWGLGGERLALEHLHLDADRPPALDTALAQLAAEHLAFAWDGHPETLTQGPICPQYVKLAPKLVRQIHQDAERRAHLAGLLREAADQGCISIAEGVEDSRDLRALADLGCDWAQGFLLGRPAEEPATTLSRGVQGILNPRPANPRLHAGTPPHLWQTPG
ncbi:MAG: EAL domain-containing protein [Zoogloea sp.]|uniref:EAL domain-containing protein n=1 Tax=Zoogloea sp. TaxID=49181 RepID=UPI003F3B799F